MSLAVSAPVSNRDPLHKFPFANTLVFSFLAIPDETRLATVSKHWQRLVSEDFRKNNRSIQRYFYWISKKLPAPQYQTQLKDLENLSKNASAPKFRENLIEILAHCCHRDLSLISRTPAQVTIPRGLEDVVQIAHNLFVGTIDRLEGPYHFPREIAHQLSGLFRQVISPGDRYAFASLSNREGPRFWEMNDGCYVLIDNEPSPHHLAIRYIAIKCISGKQAQQGKEIFLPADRPRGISLKLTLSPPALESLALMERAEPLCFNERFGEPEASEIARNLYVLPDVKAP